MKHFLLWALAVTGVCLFAAALVGQDWKNASTLPGIDLSNLSAAQKATVLKILREQNCSCGCSMKLAECRIADPGCSYSVGLATAVIEAIRSGKSEADAIAAANGSKWAHVQPRKLLDDPVTIPVSGAPEKGPQNAQITIVEFSDFQCPYCIAAVPQIDALMKTYPNQVKLIFKQFPLEMHAQAEFAATAALAAHKQGKFWAMHDALFAHHGDLSHDAVLAAAKENGLDLPRLESDMNSTEVRETLIRDVQDGNKAGVEGTPTLFINGQRYNGPIVFQALKPVLEAQLKQAAPASQRASAGR